MNNNCIFAGDSCCLYDACQAVRKATKEAEKVTPNEVDELFREAKKMMKTCKITQETEIDLRKER